MLVLRNQVSFELKTTGNGPPVLTTEGFLHNHAHYNNEAVFQYSVIILTFKICINH